MKLARPYLPLLLVPLLVILLLLTSGSWLVARKVIAFLIMPAGFLWIAGLTAALWPGLRKRTRGLLLVLWIVYSLAGNRYVGIELLHSLEEPYLRYEEIADSLDAAVVLGGATVRTPSGKPALGMRGDRVLRPAIHFFEGNIKTLICTGRSVTEIGEDRLLSREASEIWQGLGIPKDRIIEISEPRNTSEELAAVKKLIESNPQWERIGLSTSASHMNRAMGEARKHGLEFIPVPSDFRSSPQPYVSHYLIPQSWGFQAVQSALWERLGSLF